MQAGQQSALASGTGPNRAALGTGVPGWLGNTAGLSGTGLPWFAQHAHREHAQPQPTLPFQIPDFIKHAAQQHLAAQQVAQLKVSYFL